MDLKTHIESIPGFPREGIIFRDITPILADPQAMKEVSDEFADFAARIGANKIAAPEARGFFFGVPAAMNAQLPFYPVRKPGKLPRKTISKTYDLEYGTDTLQIHADAIQPGDKVLIVDDLLATGGTVQAIVDMIRELGAETVGLGFVIELDDLKGRDLFGDIPILALTHYEGE